MVGDPKQSIYRFRRADIGTYQKVKARMPETGGDVHAAGTRSHVHCVFRIGRIV